MSTELLTPPERAADPSIPSSTIGRPAVDWRRMRRPLALVCILASFVAAVATSMGSVFAGRIAEEPTGRLLALLALCVVGGAVIDTVARTAWAGIADRAEGQLRTDLLDAVLAQPLTALNDQAVGEILDRIDDDTHEVGTLLRQSVWMAMRTVLASGPLWLVAGFTWWPAFVLFPVAAGAAGLAMRRLLPEVSRLKVIEEAAWTEHAAALEEGVSARDDLRTSLGQAHVIRRTTELAAVVHERFAAVLRVEASITRRTGILLHLMLAGICVTGIALVMGGEASVAQLVTLFLVTTMFVGQVDELARHLPDLQAGFGAVLRLREMLAVEAEPIGGQALPHGDLDIEFRDLSFAYEAAAFALREIQLRVPPATTCALVGRTGSGKSTLASLLSRAVEPDPGTVLLGGVDVLDLDLQQLRSAVGVVTQNTEIISGTLAENITLFANVDRDEVKAAVAELALTGWVASLPDGLDTLLGPGGLSLSAGEEQLVAFARLLVRRVRVIVLDEATARMDPVTEARVVKAAERLLEGRTGILVAHRLSTTERATQVAVLENGRLIQSGLRSDLATCSGPFRRLLEAAERDGVQQASLDSESAIGSPRRSVQAPQPPALRPTPSLARATWNALRVEPKWGLLAAALFLLCSLTGAFGAITGWIWGRLVSDLSAGEQPVALIGLLIVSMLAGPLLIAQAIALYPRWWIAVMLRVRTIVLLGQINERRLPRTPPGEAVARAMDADRLARYADRWVDFANGLVIVVVVCILSGSWLAGGVLLAVMVAAAGASSLGRRVAGRSAAASSAARARFGRSLVSTLESARTVKLAAATPDVHAHLETVDAGRVDAAVREHRVQALLDGVPVVMVQGGVVAAWAGLLTDQWSLAVALLVANAVAGFDWFGRVAGSVVTEAPGTRAWMEATSALAGGGDLMAVPDSIDLIHGTAPLPSPGVVDPLDELQLVGFSAIHDDGTVGIEAVDLRVRAGQLVLIVGQVGSGKSSLLSGLAGLVSHRGTVSWNGRETTDAEHELRPGRIAHVAQVPRVLSGTFADNIRLDHSQRQVEGAIKAARLSVDVTAAGGPEALVGHRGVRLSGGQVQRLALARALACDAEILLADDVSSALDAETEIEMWSGLREARTTVIGATSKSAALAQADVVVVVAAGTVVATGPWHELSPTWGHLAG